MGLRNRKQEKSTGICIAGASSMKSSPFGIFENVTPLSTPETKVYYALREAVPVIDAAIFKLVRLTGGFSVKCRNPVSQRELDRFTKTVRCGSMTGLDSFISSYFEQLLTCGTAVAEMITDTGGVPAALCIASPQAVELAFDETGSGTEIRVITPTGSRKVRYPELCLLSVLNPLPGHPEGCSLLKGLPFVSGILLKIFNTTGINWDRAGNIRFAVTCKPPADSAERAYTKERVELMAQQWSEAMQPGAVRDFIASGDVSIKVIGADNIMPDSSVPVKQLLEQIVAKTGLPPFILGLSWSSTERMSSQQADALTSELEAYRRILTPVIEKICRTYLRRLGLSDDISVEWDDITLQDEVALSQAQLNRAKAESIIKNI